MSKIEMTLVYILKLVQDDINQLNPRHTPKKVYPYRPTCALHAGDKPERICARRSNYNRQS